MKKILSLLFCFFIPMVSYGTEIKEFCGVTCDEENRDKVIYCKDDNKDIMKCDGIEWDYEYELPCIWTYVGEKPTDDYVLVEKYESTDGDKVLRYMKNNLTTIGKGVRINIYLSDICWTCDEGYVKEKGGIKCIKEDAVDDVGSLDVSKAQKIIDNFKERAKKEASVWKTAEGNFNGTRLAADITAGVVLGTVGGVVTGNVVKKNQIKKGFEVLHCTIGGQKVADWGDEFTIGLQK